MRPQLAVLARCLAGLAVLPWGFGANAEEPTLSRRAEGAPVRSFVNLRIGGTSSSNRMELCLEVSPLERWSLESCGTGSQILHRTDSPELAHFRVKYTLTQWNTQLGWLQPRVGLGFTELQVGEDDAGFQFTGVGPRGVETAGPSVSLGLRALRPVGAGFELAAELGFSAAWLPFASQLVTPRSSFQPAVGFTVGGGF